MQSVISVVESLYNVVAMLLRDPYKLCDTVAWFHVHRDFALFSLPILNVITRATIEVAHSTLVVSE